jgi:hypothetical protein
MSMLCSSQNHIYWWATTLTTAILIRARSVVQVHPGPPITSKYAAIFTFSLPGACSKKATCQKFAKSSSRLAQPSIRVGECGFRSFWTIRATGTIDSRVSPMGLQCTHAYGPSHFQLSVIAEAHCPEARAQCNYRRERKWKIQPLSCPPTSCRHCTG